jgi:redox-sensitive bicupin YhaK (pirin superfamily)
MQKEKAKIFLADERGLNELDWFRSYNTFNFGSYFNKHKKAFGNLYVLNDDTLAGRRSLSMTLEENTDVILIPVAGTVVYKDSFENKNYIEAGQVQFCSLTKDAVIHITNPYKTELVNFLQIWIKNPGKNPDNIPQLVSFDLNAGKNKLIELSFDNIFIKTGKYKGRSEDIYKISNPGSGLFVFIIEGTFEVQGRLLHARDGLALWNINEVEFEALSNDAIIVLLETVADIR